MTLENILFSTLKFLWWINAIIVLIRFWLRHQTTKKDLTNKETTWSWEDAIQLIILILSTAALCVLPFLISSFLNEALGTWMIVVICASSYLRYAVNVIPSTKAIGLIINDKTNTKLTVKENVAIFLLALVVLILYQLQIQDKIISYAISCNNPIWGDIILAIISFLSISCPIFFICALAVNPLQFLIESIRRLVSRISMQKTISIEARLARFVSGNVSNRIVVVSLIKIIKTKTWLMKIPFILLVIPAFALDIIRYTLFFAIEILVSIVWYTYLIIKQITSIVIGLGKWILSLSDKSVVAVSFRVTIVLGLSIIVAINRYTPFFLRQEESTAILEFVASTIIIPVILEWILSNKGKRVYEKNDAEPKQ